MTNSASTTSIPEQQRLSPPPRRRKGRIIAFVALLVLVSGGAWWGLHRDGTDAAKAGKRDMTVPVSLATIAKGDIDIIDTGLGTVTPLANVTVRTQISGQLQEIAFKEGQIVQKGDFLAQIDPRPYQMTLEQATGALQRDQALLSDAKRIYARYEALAKQDSIAKQQLDTQAALVAQYQGDITADQGQIDAANLNIAYCHIVAPVSGRVGLRQVDAGNYVQTSDTNGVAVVTQLDPISALFTLPEDQLPAVMKRLATGAELSVIASNRSGSAKLAEGKLVAVDNQIDPTTGTVKLRAQFSNPENVLFPNQFVNIQVLVDTEHNVITAPTAAILRGSAGSFVYVAKDDGTVAMRPVKLGVTQGDKVEITEGLAEGEKVVTDGTDKLADGAKYKLPGADGADGGAGQHGHEKKPLDQSKSQ